MAIKDLEKAQLVVGVAKTVVETHDAVLGKFAKGRVDFDLAMVGDNEGFEPSKILRALDAIRNDVVEFEKRILRATGLNSFLEFRRLVFTAQNQLDEVSQFMQIIDHHEYYLRIYQETGVPPQRKEEEQQKEYNHQEQVQLLSALRIHHDKAVEIFLETASKLDIGEASPIEIPSLVI